MIAPATWLLSAVGALGYAEAELIYSLSDIGTKVILTSVIAAGEITV